MSEPGNVSVVALARSSNDSLVMLALVFLLRLASRAALSRLEVPLYVDKQDPASKYHKQKKLNLEFF